jgi:hypothetical protein
MPEYNLEFGRKFAQVAEETVRRGLNDDEDYRVVAYISRLSMELCLKAFLEHAGVSVPSVRAMSHNLRSLLVQVGNCEVEIDLAPGQRKWLSASRLRAEPITLHGSLTTVGAVVDAEESGASRYPNELRYGGHPRDFHPETLAATAIRIGDWIQRHWNSSRVAP